MLNVISNIKDLIEIDNIIYRQYNRLNELDITNKKDSIEYKKNINYLRLALLEEEKILNIKYSNKVVNSQICHFLLDIYGIKRFSTINSIYNTDHIYARIYNKLFPRSDFYYQMQVNDNLDSIKEKNGLENLSEAEVANIFQRCNISLDFIYNNAREISERKYVSESAIYNYEKNVLINMLNYINNNPNYGEYGTSMKYVISFINPLIENNYLYYDFKDNDKNILNKNEMRYSLVFYGEQFVSTIKEIEKYKKNTDEKSKLVVQLDYIYLECLLKCNKQFYINYYKDERNMTELYRIMNCNEESYNKVLSLLKKYGKE